MTPPPSAARGNSTTTPRTFRPARKSCASPGGRQERNWGTFGPKGNIALGRSGWPKIAIPRSGKIWNSRPTSKKKGSSRGPQKTRMVEFGSGRKAWLNRPTTGMSAAEEGLRPDQQRAGRPGHQHPLARAITLEPDLDDAVLDEVPRGVDLELDQEAGIEEDRADLVGRDQGMDRRRQDDVASGLPCWGR